MEETEEKPIKILESPKPVAFTVDFGENRPLDTSKYKTLVEKYQHFKHRRNQSLSKIEDEHHKQATKKPLTGHLPRKTTYGNEGYVSSDEKSSTSQKSSSVRPGQVIRSTVLTSALKKELTLPLKCNNDNRMVQSFPSRSFDLPTIDSPEIELKDISSPELDLISPLSPLTSNPNLKSPSNEEDSSSEDFMIDKFKSCIEINDNVSEAGTYTIETDNYTEEQKQRMSIDQDYNIEQVSVEKKTQEYIQNLIITSSPVQEFHSTNQKETCQKISVKKNLNNKVVNLSQRISRVEYAPEESLEDRGVFTLVTASGVLNKKQSKNNSRSNNLVKSVVALETYPSTETVGRKGSPNAVRSPISSNHSSPGHYTNRDDCSQGINHKNIGDSPIRQGKGDSPLHKENRERNNLGDSPTHQKENNLGDSPIHQRRNYGEGGNSPTVQRHIRNYTELGDSHKENNLGDSPTHQRLSFRELRDSRKGNNLGDSPTHQRGNCRELGDFRKGNNLGDSPTQQRGNYKELGDSNKGNILGDSPTHQKGNYRELGDSPSLRKKRVNVGDSPGKKVPTSDFHDLSDSSLETESYLKPTQRIITSLQQRLSLDSDSDDPKYLPILNNEKTNTKMFKNKTLHVRHNSFDDKTLKLTNKLEHFQTKSFNIDQTLLSKSNQYNKLLTNSPIRRSSSFSLKNQLIDNNTKYLLNTQVKDKKINQNIQRSSSTANIKPKELIRRASVNSDSQGNNYIDTDSSSEEDYEKKPKKDLTNTRYNRAFSLRRARLDNEPQINQKCPNTPEMKRKFTERTVSVDRKSSVHNQSKNDVQPRYMNITKAPPKSAPPSNKDQKHLLTPKNLPKPQPSFSRTDSGRFSLRSPKPSQNSKNVPKKDLHGKKQSGPRSNSTLSSREVEFQNWKRRKSYDPMKAAAEGKRKAELAKRVIMTQSYNENNQEYDSSPSHSSSVHRSQSFHGTAALEQNLISSEDDELTLSGEDGFSPPIPSPSQNISPIHNRQNVKTKFWKYSKN